MESQPEEAAATTWPLPACLVNGTHGVFDGEDSDPLARYLLLVYPIVFILIGVPADIVSMAIWARRIRDSQGSASLYLTVLCGVDSIVLCQSCLRHLLMTVSCLDLHQVLGCKLPLFLHTWLSTFSVWIICLMCFERLVCVIWPFDMKTICRARNGTVSLVTVAILCACVTIYLPVIIDMAGVQCDARPEFQHLAPYFHTLDSIAYSYLPFALIVALNSVIVIQLSKRRRRLGRNSGGGSGGASVSGSNQRRSSNKMFFTVFCMALCHLLFTAPIVAWHIRASDWCNASQRLVTCVRLEFTWKMLEELNHLTHFFIFSFTSPMFMSDLKVMCPWLANQSRRSRAVPEASRQRRVRSHADVDSTRRPICWVPREPRDDTCDDTRLQLISVALIVRSEATAVDCQGGQLGSDFV